MHPLEEIRHTANRLATECRRIVHSTNVYQSAYRQMAFETMTALEIAVEATKPLPAEANCDTILTPDDLRRCLRHPLPKTTKAPTDSDRDHICVGEPPF